MLRSCLSTKAKEHYLTLDAVSVEQPLFYFNYSTNPEHSPWQQVPTEVWPPCVLPTREAMQTGGGLIFHILDQEPENLVKAALRNGLDLTVKQLDQVISANRVELPEKGKGSGSGGSLLKRDKVTALINHFFPECSQEFRDELIDRMASAKKKPDIQECPDDILDFVRHLDRENAAEYERVIEMANEMKRERDIQKGLKKTTASNAASTKEPAENVEPKGAEQKKKVQPPETQEKGEDKIVKKAEPFVAHEGTSRSWSSHTPQELRELLPGKHTLPYVYLKHHQNRYQGVYQCV